MGSGPHLERNGCGDAKKIINPNLDQLILEVIFELLEHLWQCRFLRFFFGRPFFDP